MNKEDKLFFKTELAKLKVGIESKIQSLDQKIGILDQKIDRNTQALDYKIDRACEELSTEIRHNGVLIENLENKIDFVAENTTGLVRRVTALEEHVGIA